MQKRRLSRRVRTKPRLLSAMLDVPSQRLAYGARYGVESVGTSYTGSRPMKLSFNMRRILVKARVHKDKVVIRLKHSNTIRAFAARGMTRYAVYRQRKHRSRAARIAEASLVVVDRAAGLGVDDARHPAS